ncbi:sugar kinase [Halostagnicola larsenii XH-48]|uniref:Sugar kinase n=1 Tax=Halostagnicola larsenii XH-48 TaxID=797299 RepID=W0JRG9_9EURY|nr:PfkB family carbohydrate kinase [Halostagnicola larsenii]AHF99592.1 sugar kinase [Halostagnicola larsenii XH-48]
MSNVVTLGSVNVDRATYCSRGEIRTLESAYDWFPALGETVRTERIPAAIADDEFRNRIGGKGSNQAVAAASGGAESTFLGTVGKDERTYEVLSTLEDRGVVVDSVAVAECETGKAYIFVDDDGESWIAILGGANEAVGARYVERHYDRIRNADTCLLQNEIPLSTMQSLLGKLAGEAVRPTVVLNPVPTDGVEPLLTEPAVDIVVVNEAEYDALEGELEAFEGTIVRTRGGDNVIVSGETSHRVTPPSVDPVDTTGAGDVFCGYLGAQLADGRSIETATDIATVAASVATETEGAQESIPALEEVTDLEPVVPGQ